MRRFLRLRGVEVGDEFEAGEHRYLLVGYSPYRRKNGRKAQLAHWLGRCETCGWSPIAAGIGRAGSILRPGRALQQAGLGGMRPGRTVLRSNGDFRPSGWVR